MKTPEPGKKLASNIQISELTKFSSNKEAPVCSKCGNQMELVRAPSPFYECSCGEIIHPVR